MAKYCKYCGEPVGTSAKFCGKCGEPVEVIIAEPIPPRNVVVKIVSLVVLAALVILLLSQCFGGSAEDKLIGSWYVEKNNSYAFTLYDDGTCKIDGEYGTGTWSIVNDSKLKLTNFYGQSVVSEVIDLSNDTLVLGRGDSTQALVKGD